MCSPNIFSLSPRKSPRPCAASRLGPNRRILCGLLAALAVVACAGGPASAQVERRQLPVLQGEPASPPPAYEPQAPMPQSEPGYGAEPSYGVEPGYESSPGHAGPPPARVDAPQPLVPPAAGGFEQSAPAASPAMPAALPADPWQGLDAGAVQSLLQGVKLPSPSPALARLIARSLAT